MKTYRTAEGRQRLYIEDEEIEATAEDELKWAGLLPSEPAPIDIEAFLEKHLRVVLNQYAELPDDVLGMTKFNPGKPPHSSINKTLTAQGADDDHADVGIRGRWRATLAHEGGHVLFGSSLFQVGNPISSLPAMR
jgi:hypothetical protein